ATTLCLLIWIEPETPGFNGYGATDTNRAVRYDPGSGEKLFQAAIGMEPTEIQAAADVSVDNAEARQLMPVYDFPVSEEAIAAGVYDYARFSIYLVNYEDLTPGRHCVLQDGTIGKVSVRDDGLSFVNELRFVFGRDVGVALEVVDPVSASVRHAALDRIAGDEGTPDAIFQLVAFLNREPGLMPQSDPAIVRVRQDFQRAAGVAAAGELHAARGKGVRVPITVHIASFDPEGQGVFQPDLGHGRGLEVDSKIDAAPVALDLRPRKRRAGRHRAVNRAAGLGVLGADFLLQLGGQSAQFIDDAQAVVADGHLADGALVQDAVTARR